MSASVPQKMRALTQSEKGAPPKVREVAVPTLGANDVLIKLEYASINPTDWKHSALFTSEGCALGCDYYGTVAALGSSPANTSLKVGDRVCGCVHGGLHPDEGSFAEYVKAQSDLVIRAPAGYQGGEPAQMGIAWLTAVQILILSQGGQWPGEGKVADSPYYLVYGASTSVGLFVLQLAKAMGYRPIGVASARNFDLVKSYGAEATVDYHDADWAEQVKKISGGGVELGADCVTEEDTVNGSLAAFKDGGKGKQLNGLLPFEESSTKLAKEKGVALKAELMYCLLGKDTYFGPDWKFEQKPEDRAFGVETCRRTPGLIEKFAIKPNPTDDRVGLEKIPQAFDDMKNGRVSGKKITIKIA